MALDLHIDFETCSQLDLRKVGASKYAAHPSTRVLCVAYAEDNDPVRFIILPTLVDMANLYGETGITTHAWNAAFERAILRHKFTLFPHEWSCTMQRALYAGLPAKLEEAAKALHSHALKNMTSHRLMLKMSKPRADGSFWHQDPTNGKRMLQELATYCMQDVEAERAMASMLPELPDFEDKVSVLDVEVNHRGLRIDLPLVDRLMDIAKQETAKLDAECMVLTNGAVTSPGTQTARLTDWLRNEGFDFPDVSKETVAEALDFAVDTEMPENVIQVLSIRQRIAKSSTKKLQAMLNGAEQDERVRGTLQYYGAGRTGRWAGRLIQPQNMPSRKIFKQPNQIIDRLLKDLRIDADEIRTFFGDPLWIVSSCLRGCLIPTEGNKFLVFDFAQIEARCLCWLAGQDDGLRLFASGNDVYTINANRFGLTSRDAGKVVTLGLGFGTGWKKFIEMAKGYGLIIDEIESQRIVTEWRAANAKIVAYWYELDRTIKDMLQLPGRVQTSVRAAVLTLEPPMGNSSTLGERLGRELHARLLTIKMPSGQRCLYYQNMRIVLDAEGRPALCYDGIDQKTGRYGPVRTWGAKIAENITQAMARDVLAEAAVRVEQVFEDVGMVLSVHDELVFETYADTASIIFPQVLAVVQRRPKWAPDLPVKAEGQILKRYGK